MATIDTEKYTRINLMLVKGGTKLTKRLFLQRIKDLSPEGQEYTVDEFLNNNKTKILKTTTGKNKSKTLYPSSGNTNLDDWDLYLLCFVLEEICELKFINKKDVEKLQKMRNKLCHVNEPTLTNDEFEERLEKLKIIFTRSLRLINDADFATSLNDDIDNFETGPLSVTDIVKFNHQFSQIELQRLEIIANQNKMLDNQTKIMGSQDELMAMAKSTASLLEDISHRLPPFLTVDIPTIQIIIEVNNCSGDPKETLLDFIMSQFNENIAKPECNIQQEFPNIAMHKISEAVSRTFNAFLNNGRYLVKAEKKCILLTILCKNVHSFVDLVRDCLGCSLPNQLEDLQNAARNLKGCENVVLEPVIYLKDIISAMYDLVKSLDTKIPKGNQESMQGISSAHTISDGNGLSHSDSTQTLSTRQQNQCLRITIRPVTDDGRRDFNTILKSGNVQRGLQEIQTEMKKEPNYSDVNIGFRVSGSDLGWKASQHVDEADETVFSKHSSEDAMDSSAHSKQLFPKHDFPLAIKNLKEKKETGVKEFYQNDKVGDSMDDIETGMTRSLFQGKTNTFTKTSDSQTKNISNGLPPENKSEGNVFVSVADTEASSAEVVCDSASSVENVIYTRTKDEIDNGFHPDNDPDDPFTACLDEDSFSESESDSLNLMPVSSTIGIPGLLRSAKEKLYFEDLDGACDYVRRAIRLLDIEKGETLSGQNSEISDSQLAKWYEDCSFILSQQEGYYSDCLDEILCYYNGILFDQRWKPGRRHSEIVDILLGKLHYELWFYTFLHEMLIEELEKIAVIAKERGRPQLCISIDRDIDNICRYYSHAEKEDEPRWKDALLRSARCYLDLGCHIDARTACSNVLRHFCDYNDVEAFELWSRSLCETKEFDIALDKCALALKYCENDEDMKRIQELKALIEKNVQKPENRPHPDEDWLRGTHAWQKEDKKDKESASTKQKRKHKRPKAKEKKYVVSMKPDSQKTAQVDKKKNDTTAFEKSKTTENYSMKVPDEDLTDPDKTAKSDQHSTWPMDEGFTEGVFQRSKISESDSTEEEYNRKGDKMTFFDQSRLLYEGHSQAQQQLKAEENLLKYGLQLNEEFLNKFEDKRPEVLKRDPFYPEFISVDDMRQKLLENPKKYIKCTIYLDSSHEAFCVPIESKQGLSRIEISGRSKIGMVFNEDQVVVELFHNKDIKQHYGKVVGVWERQRHKHVNHPVFICTLDQQEERNLLRPVCKTIPKIHVIDQKLSQQYKTPKEKINKLEIYEYDEDEQSLKNPKIHVINPADRDAYLFLVVYIHWSSRHIYPRGAVIKKIRCGESLGKCSRILNLQYQIPRLYSKEAVHETDQLIASPGKFHQNRHDLTRERIYIVAKEGSSKFEWAFSVEALENGFKLGVHVIDVACFIKKDTALDLEAFNRGMTINPEIDTVREMFPEPLCTQVLSLLPDEQRPTISVYMYLSNTGLPLQEKRSNLELKPTCIKPRKLLTYSKIAKILSEQGESKTDEETTRFVKQLLNIASQISRRRKCGGIIMPTKQETKMQIHLSQEVVGEIDETHIESLIREVLLLANTKVTERLLNSHEVFVPLYHQPPPTLENAEKFWKTFDMFIHIVSMLQSYQIGTRYPNINECAKSSSKQLKLMISKEIWDEMLKGPESAALYLKNDNLHSIQLIIRQHWLSIQQRGEYVTCRNRSKTEERKDARINLTSPLERYSDLLSQRLIHAVAFERKKCPFDKEDVKTTCIHLNSILHKTSQYEKECKDLKILSKLHKRPRVFTCVIDELSEKGFTVCVPYLSTDSPVITSLAFNVLDLAFKPEGRHLENTLDSGSVKVVWKKRLYDFNIRPKQQQCTESKFVLNPHRNVVFVPLHEWAKMIKCVSGSRDLEKMVKRANVSTHNEGVDDVTTECFDSLDFKPFTTFSLTFSRGQQINLQISAVESSGKLVLKPLLYNVTKNFQICLQHMEDPVKHLYRYSILSTREQYDDIDDYLQRWIPLLLMESSKGVVKNEESCYINNVPLRFTDNKTGKFALGLAGCEVRNIELSGTEDGDEQSDGVHCYDWLCLKKVIPKENPPSDETSSDFGQSDAVWVGHAAVTRVQKLTENSGRLIVSFTLTENSPDPPANFLQRPVNVNVELLRKFEVDRRTEGFLKMLKESGDTLASRIALNAEIPELDKTYKSIAEVIERDLYYNISPDQQQFYRLPRNNVQQQIAIDKAILSRFSLIHGPPGTGKTYTGIKLLYLFNEINKMAYKEGQSRKQVLFCGPSNKSVDLVAKFMLQRMGNLKPNFVRVYGRSIETLEFPVPGRTFQSKKTIRTQSTPHRLKEVALHHLIRNPARNKHAQEILQLDRLFKDNNYKPMPLEVKKYVHLVREASIEEIRKHDVILCTTAVGSNPKVLQATSVQQVVIDEAGMCPEPQCLVPIIATKAEQVVLIGDHKQLRPIIMCKEAAQLGLDTSLFERYAALYEHSGRTNTLEDNPFTMLTEQYRMHEEICRFPSEAFYGGKLTTYQSPYAHSIGLRLDIWPKKDKTHYPHVFVHVEGEEKALTVTTEEGNEQSRSNTAEIDHVIKVYTYLEKIKQSKEKIHILSQYNAQCSEIRRRLKETDKSFDEESVSTVVSSQGGEWDYVIFSTVCSLPDYKIERNPTLGWCKHNLGFITDQNQVNVALTRAQKGLVIIGNKNLLACDKIWGKLIQHYETRGCLKTPDEFPPSLQKLSKIIKSRQDYQRQQSLSDYKPALTRRTGGKKEMSGL